MIENANDLKPVEADLKEDGSNFWELVNSNIQEKLGLSIDDLKKTLYEYLQKSSEELSLDLNSIAVNGDYSNLLEDNDSMTKFLKEEASDPKYWNLFEIKNDETNESLLRFSFNCSAVDDGNTLIGKVFVSKSGKIRHYFIFNDS